MGMKTTGSETLYPFLAHPLVLLCTFSVMCNLLQGCVDTMKDWALSNLLICGGLAVLVLFIEVCADLLTFGLCRLS